MVVTDIQHACDILRSVYDATDRMGDYVSLQVSPYLARDTAGTIQEARWPRHAVDRPNLFIKIPGTSAGVPAIEEGLYEGINITLLVSVRLQPNEGILHTFLAKQPGPDICLRPVTMDFRYDTTFGIEEPPSAYEWLLFDAMQGAQMLFPRPDWIYKAWSIVDPINARWEAEPATHFATYAAGSWGPAAAEALLTLDGRAWLAV